MTLYATQHLTGVLFSWKAGTLAIALYVFHDAVSSLASFPIGALTDRIGRRPVLIAGYLFTAATLQFTGALAILATPDVSRFQPAGGVS